MNTSYETAMSNKYSFRSGAEIILDHDDLEELMGDNPEINSLKDEINRVRSSYNELLDDNRFLSHDIDEHREKFRIAQDKIFEFEDIIKKLKGDEDEKN